MSGWAHFYNRAGEPIDEAEAAALLTDISKRRVAATNLPGGIFVSTVHLVLNHQFDLDAPPLIFETMVFIDDTGEDLECHRYSTEVEALEGHIAVVKSLCAPDVFDRLDVFGVDQP